MEYFNKKRPIYAGIISFVVFVILSLVLHQGKDILYWVAMSAIMAAVVATVSLRIAIQDAKNRKEFEELKAKEQAAQLEENKELSEENETIVDVDGQTASDSIIDGEVEKEK